jgi:hypothetical protein
LEVVTGYELDCPVGRENCPKKGQKSTGFNNPLRHLLGCCYDGQEPAMYNAYWAKHDKIAGQDIKNFFQPDGGYSPRDNAIFEWILLIVKNSLVKNSLHNFRRRQYLANSLETWCGSLQHPSYSARGHPFPPFQSKVLDPFQRIPGYQVRPE